MANKSYSDKLKDPRWQKKRLEIFERDGFSCQHCSDTESTLHVHHMYYEKGKEPWEYDNNALLTLCESCHENETLDRGYQEADLLQLLRKEEYSASDIYIITSAIQKFQSSKPPFVKSMILFYAITRPDAEEYYFNQLQQSVDSRKS